MADSPTPDANWLTIWRWPIAIIVLAIAAVLISRYAANTLSEYSPSRVVRESGDAGQQMMRTGVDLWRDLTKTEVDLRISEFVDGLPTAEDDLALVVTQLDMTKSLYAENTKTKWGIDLGTTKVLLSVPSKVHYAVDLTGEKPIRFEIDSERRLFRAYFPDPEVLAVEIFDENRRLIVDTGWGRLRSRSGEAMIDELERRKYSAVREKAEAPEMIDMVRQRARPVLARFIALYLQQGNSFGSADNSFESIEIHFQGDRQDEQIPSFGEEIMQLEAASNQVETILR